MQHSSIILFGSRIGAIWSRVLAWRKLCFTPVVVFFGLIFPKEPESLGELRSNYWPVTASFFCYLPHFPFFLVVTDSSRNRFSSFHEVEASWSIVAYTITDPAVGAAVYNAWIGFSVTCRTRRSYEVKSECPKLSIQWVCLPDVGDVPVFWTTIIRRGLPLPFHPLVFRLINSVHWTSFSAVFWCPPCKASKRCAWCTRSFKVVLRLSA